MKALVVTDMQKGFMNEFTKHLPAKIQQLLMRKTFSLVIFTQFINTPGSPYVKLLKYARMLERPEIEIVPELKPYADIVIKKNTYSSFTSEFEALLREKKVREIYFVGVDTNACILLGALETFNKGLTPYILASYCASHSSSDFHEWALKNLEKVIGKEQVVYGDYLHRMS